VRAYAQNLKPLSRDLRVSMTDAEQWLWHKVRRQQILGVQFYRQRPLGPYIVDFYAPRVNLVVEVDGGQHFESRHVDQDYCRDAYLGRQGLAVLRFDNLQVLKEGLSVLNAIWAHCDRARGAGAAKSPLPPFDKGGLVFGAVESCPPLARPLPPL